MELILAEAESLPVILYDALGRYRYQVFIERQGWDLHPQDGFERDAFDRSDTVHVIIRKNAEIVGCARLLPTTSPYLLGEIFPQLMNGAPPPCSDEVWELSRFAVVNIHGQRDDIGMAMPSSIASEILKAAAEFVLRRGGKRLITVSPLPMERLLRRTGFATHRAGPPSMIAGKPTVACWIELGDASDGDRSAATKATCQI
jgi:acyl homoserine lactone synthase